MNFTELRTKYKAFHYKGYKVDMGDSLNLTFEFSIDGLTDFTTTWDIMKVDASDYDEKKVDELAFTLGLIESLSIWKITCSKDFYVDCHKLDDEQSKWFKKLLINGMGEFFYRNGIEIEKYKEDIVNIISNGKNTEKSFGLKVGDNNKVLIPIGGGKDSAVSIELLNELDRYCFIINPRKATLDTFEKSKLLKDKLIVAKRTFDQKIIEFNKKGFLNGHTPFSALVSFASVLSAYINGIRNVALSNESSANESTVTGLTVNHQYSKTYEYETDFIDYEKKYIDSGVRYFSFLRPLTEVGIAKIFSTLRDYHMIFRSCNVGSKEDIWCAACAKCLFVYIILSPFIDKDKMIKIFGKDMLDDESLKDIFDKLIGKAPEKPFECVGSRNEVNAALSYILPIYEEEGYMPKLLKYYKGLNIKVEKKLLDMCMSFDDMHHIPNEYVKYIKKVQN